MSLHRHRLLVAAVLLFLSLPVFAAETAGPRIYLPEQRHDLGSVKEGDRPEYAFEIKNTGNELLLIKRIKPSWGCTAGLVSSDRLEPGASTQLKVTVNTDGKRGFLAKHVTIESNDPVMPAISVTVTMKVEGTAAPAAAGK